MQNWGKMLLSGVKALTLEEREAVKTIRQRCNRQILSIDVFFVEIKVGRGFFPFSA
jgi:hypothetical protein